MSKYLKRKIHKRANMKQILSAKEKQEQEQLLKSPVELIIDGDLDNIEIEDYCKENIQTGIKKKNFELVKQSLELCNCFNWYNCKGVNNICPLLDKKIEGFKDIVENKELCRLFKENGVVIMFKNNLLKMFTIDVNMKTIGKNINTKALFNRKDYKTSILRFNLSMDNKPLNISDCKVTTRILTGNKEKVEIESKILDAENGVVVVGLNKNALECIGENWIELLVQYNEQKLYSPKMYYIVSDNIYD